MKRIATALAVTGMLLNVGGALAQNRASYSGDGVKIGVLTDMSGIFTDLGGTGSVLAATMAIEDFKAQAKPSFKIELVSADHLNKADIGSSKAREWYDMQGVDMITDVINSAVALSVAKVSQEKNRVVMVTGAGTTRLTNEDCSPNTVHYGWDTNALANGQGRFVTAQGKDTWFFVTVDYALGKSIEHDVTEAVKSAGGKIIGSVKHPINTADFSSFMLQAQASKAKVIGIASAGGDLSNAVKAANEYGISKQQTMVGLASSITDVHGMGLATTQGMILVEDFYWDLDDQTRAWSQKFFSRQKRMPNMIHAATYSAVLTYLKAVQAIGTDSAPEVMKYMKQATIADVFAEDGRMIHDMYLMEVKKPAESKGPWDYYHIRRNIPGENAFQPLSVTRCPLLKK
jgi:branched-chain amino acid transport system substrate-binding protein